MTLRVGVVGAGWWAETVHLPAAQAATVELVGVFGRDADRTASVARQAGCIAFTSFESLLDTVDIVDFALPPAAQAELAVLAARAGKHLMLEKPLAGAVDSAREIQDAVEESGVAASVFLTRQFDPEIAQWVEEVRRSTWHSASIQLVTPAMREIGSPWSRSTWRIERGGLWDIGPHGLATAIPILGDVVDVRAFRGKADLVHAILAHRSGALSTIAVSINAPPSVEILDVSLWGESGITNQPASSISPVQALTSALDGVALMATGHASREGSNLALAADIVEVLSRIELEVSRSDP